MEEFIVSDQFTYTGYSNYGLNYNYPNTQDNIYQNDYRPQVYQNNYALNQWETGVTDIQSNSSSRNRVGDRVRVNQGVGTWATGEGMPSWVHGRVYPVIEIRTRGGATELLLGGGINSWIRQADVTAVANAAPAAPAPVTPAPAPPPTATVRVNDRVRVKQGVRTWATGEGMPSWVHGRIYPVIEIRRRGGATELLLGDGINSWIRSKDVKKVSQAATPAPTTPTATIRVNDRVKVNNGVRTWATGEGMPSWVHGRTYKVIEKRTRNDVKQLLLGDINSWIRQSDVTKV